MSKCFGCISRREKKEDVISDTEDMTIDPLISVSPSTSKRMILIVGGMVEEGKRKYITI